MTTAPPTRVDGGASGVGPQTRTGSAGPRPDRPSPSRWFRRRNSRRSPLAAWLFLLPALLSFGYFSWWPIVKSVLLSMQQTNFVDPPRWVGLDNFRQVLTDPLLGTAVLNTAKFGALTILIGFPLPLLLAIVMSELRRLGGVFRVLVYLPVIMPPVVSVLLWKFFYDPDAGLFNAVLGRLGVDPLPWLQDKGSALPSLVLLIVWANTGGTVLLYFASLSGISRELYEAAEVDGASIRRRVWHITLPQLRGMMLILLLLQIIGTLQIFIEPFVMTDGGPENSTVTVIYLIYRNAFVYGDFGSAAALSVLLALVLAVLSAVYLRLTRGWSTT
ncbi:sugar ABC transporter permease [Dactylosporangium fulvum]|uniref:Sugar ABC transporter permease n=1 Tax=Dactylosporangium fulvum TaxID=53359 RepID=A0ABY5W1H6_9ACTN|nr:sugar ABC transporter permease [Dactylosporangium fulvum]UWP83119.1 sugar ABC transporter permease [Dactylosporangium fulvum]